MNHSSSPLVHQGLDHLALLGHQEDPANLVWQDHTIIWVIAFPVHVYHQFPQVHLHAGVVYRSLRRDWCSLLLQTVRHLQGHLCLLYRPSLQAGQVTLAGQLSLGFPLLKEEYSQYLTSFQNNEITPVMKFSSPYWVSRGSCWSWKASCSRESRAPISTCFSRLTLWPNLSRKTSWPRFTSVSPFSLWTWRSYISWCTSWASVPITPICSRCTN